jgi:dipeptidyl aminopeptidase/acylaminoacyl peptidase
MKLFVVLTLVFASPVLAQTPSPSPPASAKHPFTFEDMMKLKRLDEPVPSPDGKWVVFSATDVDLDANTKTSHLWIVPANGGESKRLNETPNHEERPRFSPDGKHLIWTSKATDPTQIWMCDFDAESGTLVGKPHQVTNISTGADGGIWSPDGKNIVFVSAVYPDCKDDACNKQRDEELKKSKVKAKIFTRLFYRHWNAFTEFKRSHLFVVSAGASAEAGGDAVSVSGNPTASPTEARDLTPGDHDVPPFHLGGQDMYAISPDGQELAYTSNIDEVEATSTNNEIFVVSMTGPATAGKKISTSPGADSTPLYSPDGKYIAWKSQARAGFEADKWRLFLYDRANEQLRDRTKNFDRSVGSFAFMSGKPEPHEKYVTPILFAAENQGNSPVFFCLVDDDEPPTSDGTQLHADDLTFGRDALYFTRMSISAPGEIWRLEFMSDKPNMTSNRSRT